MEKRYIYSGLISPIIGFAFVAIAIYLNSSWWSITDNAISDLGNINNKFPVNHPWVLSSGLIIAGLGMTYFAHGLQKEFSGLTRYGVFVFYAGMIFLTLIGVFPEGTPPHWYVSWLFFLVSSFGILITGIGLIGKNRTMGALSLILFFVGWILASWALLTFEGVAIAELIGAGTLFVWTYTLIYFLLKGKL
jgi:hypothetical membrane protein